MPEDPSLLQSPRAQVFENNADPGDEESNFVQGFSDLAKKALAKAQPALVANAVTFRVLEKDVSAGDGLGTFIIKLGGEILFIPVVLVENAIKPLDVFYCRSRDRYYPLTPEWLRDVATSGVSPLGSAIDTPKNRTHDIDIRRLVVPPTVGRFGYASYDDPGDGWDAFRHLKRELPSDGMLRFPQAVSRLPNGVKVAFLRSLDRMPRVARLLGAQYGVPTIKEAAAPVEPKVASFVESPVKKDVFLADSTTTVQELQRELGPEEAAKAYAQIRTDGIYVHDKRPQHNEVVALAEGSLDLEEVHGLGLFRFFMTDGSTKVGLAIPSPRRMGQIVQDDPSGAHANLPHQSRTTLVLFPDGSFSVLNSAIGQPVPASPAELDRYIATRAQDCPHSPGVGVLLGPGPRGVWATEPHDVRDINHQNGAVNWRANDMAVTRVKGMGGAITQPTGQRALFVGEKAAWWPLGQYVPASEIYANAELIWRRVMGGLAKTGALRMDVGRGLGGEFILGTPRVALSGARAVVKLAQEYGVSLADAANVLTAVGGNAKVAFWMKRADAAPPGGGGGGPGDPNAGMDPSMMMPPPGPPPPTGLDLAVAEQSTVIQSQIAALQQSLVLLQQVQQRAMGIDQGGGAMAAPQGATAMMGAPPPSVMGGPAMAPMSAPAPMQGQPQMGMPGMPTGMPGMPPGMPGMGQPQMGMPGMQPQGMPGMQPQGMPGMQPQGMPMGQPPMGGPQMGMPMGQPPMGMQPGMQPPGMQPGMMPGMPGAPMAPPGMQQQGQMMPPQPQDIPVMTDPPTPENISGQVSPQFLEDAQVLGDPSIFDASAIAAFSQPRALQEIFKNYAPVLDNALDKLGRALILIYTQSRDIREKLGDEALRTLEQKTRNVFRELGATLRLMSEHGDQIDDTGADSTLL